MLPENIDIIKNFNDFILERYLNGKINIQKLIKDNILTYILMFGHRIKSLSYDDVIGFKFKTKKEYIKLPDGRKITGIVYVSTCSSLGFIIDGEIQYPLIDDDIWVEIIKRIFKESNIH